MARRKSHTKRVHHRRRRHSRGIMGAVGSSAITNALGLIGGAVVARVLQNKVAPTLDAKIKSAGILAVGLFLPKFLKGNIGQAVGGGMVAAGGLGLAQALMPNSPFIGADYTLPVSVVAGDGLSVISGEGGPQVMAGGYTMDNLSVVAGMDEEYPS